jgi:hypothetical protein
VGASRSELTGDFRHVGALALGVETMKATEVANYEPIGPTPHQAIRMGSAGRITEAPALSLSSVVEPFFLTPFSICLTMLDKWLNSIHLANLNNWCSPPS